MSRPNGFKHSEETKEKIRQSLNGHIHSEETKKKIGIKSKGRFIYFNHLPKSIEIRNKISATNKRKGIEPVIKSVRFGSNNNKWKGGITSSDKLERTKFKATVQKLVLERDNYTCQVCNARGVRLHVDHIKSWKDYKELRFDLDNCRTLCVKCHYEITFGRKMTYIIQTWGLNKQSKPAYE